MERHAFEQMCRSAFDEMKKQSMLYQPTDFWAGACIEIFDNIKKEGISNFRRAQLPLSYFVPTYGYPGNGLGKPSEALIQPILGTEMLSEKQQQTLTAMLSGRSQAEADYRVLLASHSVHNKSNLMHFSESKVGDPIEHFEFDGNWYSRSALNYLLGLCFLNQYTPISDIRTVVEIGGGYGTLGEVLVKTNDKIRYLDFDIAPTLNVAEYYLSEVFGKDNVGGFFRGETPREVVSNARNLNVFGAWQIEELNEPIDLFVNFISFQEMEPEIVQNYLHHIDRVEAKWVLLRNIREGKQSIKTHGFGVKDPIFTDDYGRMLPNYELVANNVRPFGLKTIDGFHSELLLLKRKA